MLHLSMVILAKIRVTIAFWCIPLLLFPAGLLKWLGFLVPEPQIFLRLLGLAYLALVVGYAFGLRDLRSGSYPNGVVWMGITSNGSACTALIVAAGIGVWEDWEFIPRIYMWLSLIATGGITMGLVIFGPIAIRLGHHFLSPETLDTMQ